MDIRLQPNEYLITDVSVTPNPHTPDLLRLVITEGAATELNLTLPAPVWQRVAAALAAAGITPVAVSS